MLQLLCLLLLLLQQCLLLLLLQELCLLHRGPSDEALREWPCWALSLLLLRHLPCWASERLSHWTLHET